MFDFFHVCKDIAAKGSVKNIPEIIKKPDGQGNIQSKEYKEAYPDVATGIERKQDGTKLSQARFFTCLQLGISQL